MNMRYSTAFRNLQKTCIKQTILNVNILLYNFFKRFYNILLAKMFFYEIIYNKTLSKKHDWRSET